MYVLLARDQLPPPANNNGKGKSAVFIHTSERTKSCADSDICFINEARHKEHQKRTHYSTCTSRVALITTVFNNLYN